MKTKLQDIEVTVKKREKNNFDQLNEREKNYSCNQFEFEDECFEDWEEADLSRQFLRMQKMSSLI